MSNSIDGIWYNQLGSEMTLTTDKDGGLTGKYRSAVGKAEDWYYLSGRYDVLPPPNEGDSVGWVVTFRNQKLDAHSTASWSGQYFNDSNERIITQWLLTSSTIPDNVWDSTNIGTDTFTRTKPSSDQIKVARALTLVSPHPEDIIARRYK